MSNLDGQLAIAFSGVRVRGAHAKSAPRGGLGRPSPAVLRSKVEEGFAGGSGAVFSEAVERDLESYLGSLRVYDALKSRGVNPDAFVGLGECEYAALVASGYLSRLDGMRLVALRREAIERAARAHPGETWEVFGLAEREIEAACSLASGDVWVAAYHGIGHVRIAGSAPSVKDAARIATLKGARLVRRVREEPPINTPLMAGTRASLRDALRRVEFDAGQGRVLANVDGAEHRTSSEWRRVLAAQVTSAVRWNDSVRTLLEAGYSRFIEIGQRTSALQQIRQQYSSARSIHLRDEPDDESWQRLHTHLSGVDISWDDGSDPTACLGEHLDVPESVIVSPRVGIFQPDIRVQGQEAPSTTTLLRAGDVLATVGGEPIRAAFSGELMGMLALPGERVTTGQAVAWLRRTERTARR